MMAEGQGNGSDSPERDGAWQPFPGAGGSPGDAAPEAGTGAGTPGAADPGAADPGAADPGAPEAADPGASWLPFRMTSPADEDAQPAPGTPPPPSAQPVPGSQPTPWAQPPQPVPGAQPATGAQPTQPVPGAQPATGAQPYPVPGAPTGPGQPGSGPQPGSREPSAPPAPAQQTWPLGEVSSPWQTPPGGQPSWAPPAPQQPWQATGTQGGQPGLGEPPPGAHPSPGAGPSSGGQPPGGAQPPSAGPSSGGQPPGGAQPPSAGPSSGGQPPGGAQPPSAGPAYGAQPPGAGPPGAGPAYGAQPPGAGPAYGAQPPGAGPAYGAQPAGAQPPGAGPAYGAQPPGAQPPGAQPPYGAPQGAQPGYGVPPPGYAGEPAYGTPPYGGPPGHGDQPQANWQPPAAPPLPGQLPDAVPPGGEGRWAPPGYGQPLGPRPSRGPLSTALVYLLVAVLAAAVGAGAVLALRGSGGAAPSSASQANEIPKPKSNAGPGAGSANLNGSVARKVEPGVVDITSYVHYQREVFEGTGMVLSPNGLVLTNNHVIKGSTRVVVQVVATGRKYSAQVVGTDNAQDVALLRLKGASGLKTVQVGDSTKVRLGELVVAVGNAGGTGGQPTVTSGTITDLKKTITASDAGSGTSERLTNMFQTNAPIAEGDSGGPLANSAGQVIAMNTAANSQSLGGTGTTQGFSIPIDRALSIARQIAAGHGSSTIQIGQPAFIGIAIASDPHSNAPSSAGSPRAQLNQLQQIAQGNFPNGINSSGGCLMNETANPVPQNIAPARSGTLIAGVFCNAPAAAAGAAAGDVITAVNGHAVTSPASLRMLMRQYRPGNTVTLTWIGLNGKQRTGSLKLAAGPAA